MERGERLGRGGRRLSTLAAALMLAAVAACGSTTNARPTSAHKHTPATPAPSPTPTGPQTYLVVMGSSTGHAGVEDTVQIVDASGHVALERKDPAAPPAPSVSQAVTTIPYPVVVANNTVYYMDGTGTVRKLDPTMTTDPVVAKLPFDANGQSAASYVISPDGNTLIGIVVTYPGSNTSSASSTASAFATSPVSSPTPTPRSGAAGRIDFVSATLGTAPATAKVLRTVPFSGVIPMLVGWDDEGPVVVSDVPASAQVLLNDVRRIFGHLGRLDTGLNVTAYDRAPSDCFAIGWSSRGAAACQAGAQSGSLSVSAELTGGCGNSLISAPAKSGGIEQVTFATSTTSCYIEPNGAPGYVLDASGNRTSLPSGYTNTVWVGDSLIAGSTPQGLVMVDTGSSHVTKVDRGSLTSTPQVAVAPVTLTVPAH